MRLVFDRGPQFIEGRTILKGRKFQVKDRVTGLPLVDGGRPKIKRHKNGKPVLKGIFRRRPIPEMDPDTGFPIYEGGKPVWSQNQYIFKPEDNGKPFHSKDKADGEHLLKNYPKWVKRA